MSFLYCGVNVRWVAWLTRTGVENTWNIVRESRQRRALAFQVLEFSNDVVPGYSRKGHGLCSGGVPVIIVWKRTPNFWNTCNSCKEGIHHSVLNHPCRPNEIGDIGFIQFHIWLGRHDQGNHIQNSVILCYTADKTYIVSKRRGEELVSPPCKGIQAEESPAPRNSRCRPDPIYISRTRPEVRYETVGVVRGVRSSGSTRKLIGITIYCSANIRMITRPSSRRRRWRWG